MYALNVVKVSRRKVAWKDICVLILEANRFLAITAIILVHENIRSQFTYEHTPVNVPTHVINVIIRVHRKVISRNTSARTQGKNLSPVMCAVNYSL